MVDDGVVVSEDSLLVEPTMDRVVVEEIGVSVVLTTGCLVVEPTTGWLPVDMNSEVVVLSAGDLVVVMMADFVVSTPFASVVVTTRVVVGGKTSLLVVVCTAIADVASPLASVVNVS